MKPSRILITCSCGILAFLVLVVSVVIFVPAKVMEDTLTRYLEQEGYSLRAGSFGKAFPVGIHARNVEIGDVRGSLVKLDSVTARVSIMPLFVGRLVIRYQARIGSGTIEGTLSPTRDRGFSGTLNGVRMEDVPLFRTVTGAVFRGSLDAVADVGRERDGFRGFVRVTARELTLNGFCVGGIPLPDASFDTVRGEYRISRGRGTLESLSLQGREIHGRLKGDISVAPGESSPSLNLTLELMPRPAFLQSRKEVFALLDRYRAAPGYYRIPVRGSLAKPTIQ